MSGIKFRDSTTSRKDATYVQDKVKYSLRSFTYNYIELDLKEFKLSRSQMKTLNELTETFSIPKPDKGNAIFIMKRSDYISHQSSHYLLILLNLRNRQQTRHLSDYPPYNNILTYFSNVVIEISQQEYSFMKPKSSHFARAHGLHKIHKTYQTLSPFRSIVDTTNTTHYIWVSSYHLLFILFHKMNLHFLTHLRQCLVFKIFHRTYSMKATNLLPLMSSHFSLSFH